MIFKVAAAVPLGDDSTENNIYIFISRTPIQFHKFDSETKLCLLCLNHKNSCQDHYCPGLLNPAIRCDPR